MPHRQSTYQQLCDVCRAPTNHGCLRCGVPRCAEHAPVSDRCESCEAVFSRRTRVERRVVDALAVVEHHVAMGEHETARAMRQAGVYTSVRRPIAYLPFLLVLLVCVPIILLSSSPLFAPVKGLATLFAAGSAAAMWLLSRVIPPTGPACRHRLALKRARFLRERKRTARWLHDDKRRALPPKPSLSDGDTESAG